MVIGTGGGLDKEEGTSYWIASRGGWRVGHWFDHLIRIGTEKGECLLSRNLLKASSKSRIESEMKESPWKGQKGVRLNFPETCGFHGT